MNVGLVFLAALVTALATGLGALPLLFNRHIHDRGLGLATAVAAGFMLGASAGLFWEGGNVVCCERLPARSSAQGSSSSAGVCSAIGERSDSASSAEPTLAER